VIVAVAAPALLRIIHKIFKRHEKCEMYVGRTRGNSESEGISRENF